MDNNQQIRQIIELCNKSMRLSQDIAGLLALVDINSDPTYQLCQLDTAWNIMHDISCHLENLTDDKIQTG